MAVTLTDRRTLYTEADSTTGWNTGSVVTSEPTPVEATACLGLTVSTATAFIYFTGAAVNMSAGMLVYVWVNHRAALDTTVNGGLMLMLGDGTDRIGFHVAGSDQIGFTHENGPVGWQCIVVDTATLPVARTVEAGSFAALNLAAITQIGAGFKTLAKSVGGVNNCFIDAIRYGNDGLRVTGGTIGAPGIWNEIAAADRLTGNQQGHGICRRLGEGVYGIQGPITFGDDPGTAGVYFDDSNVTVVAEARGLAVNRIGLKIEGNTTGATTVNLTGSSFISPVGVGGYLDAVDVHNNVVDLIDGSLVGLSNGITLCASSAHEFRGNTVRRCGQVQPATTVVRDCTFADYTGTAGALRWDGVSDVARCDFVSNSVGIEMVTPGTYLFDNINFVGNTVGVRNNSGGNIVIQINGGNSPTVVNVGASTTTVQNVVTLTLTGLVDNTEVRIYRMSDNVELFGAESSTGGAVAYSYDAAGPVDVYIHIHHVQYVFIRLELTLGETDASVPIQQRFDRAYSNTD